MARDTSAVGFVTVDTLGDLTAIIQKAAPGTQVRVRGAMHSVPAAIVTDPSKGVDVMLGKDFLTVEALNPSPGTLVRVGGGRRLGGDPEEGVDITDGLLYWLANAAQGPWSMTDLGGISHQTVGGFLATGSSGGSLSFSLEDQIQAIHLVDGTGTLRVIDRDLQPEDFAAVGVSMGLFGVIVAVDFLPVDRFAIVGTESTTPVGKAAFKPFAPGPGGLQLFLETEDYCRIMWWPQPKVGKFVTWRAARTPLTKGFVPKRYLEMGDPASAPANGYPADLWNILLPRLESALGEHLVDLGELAWKYRDSVTPEMGAFLLEVLAVVSGENPEPLRTLLEGLLVGEGMQFGVDLYFTLLGNRVTNPLAKALFTAIFESEALWETRWSPLIMNGVFLVDDDKKVKPGGPQTFQDYGDTGLPMDNQISDRLMPTEFTELWIPIDQTTKVMGLLRDHYATGYAATGTYACEIYGTRLSPFWMSPSYATNVIRIDLFWFARNGDMTPAEFYGPFWKLLKDANVPFRPHWGKFLPPPATYGPAYYATVYPNLDKFLALRATYDPKQIFVTDYWRTQLGIAP
jgi:hypothetical protein